MAVTELFGEIIGGFIGGLLFAGFFYSLYYGGRKFLNRFGVSSEPELFTKTAKILIVGFALLSAFPLSTFEPDYTNTTPTSQEVWINDASYYGEADVVQMHDLMYEPPQNWYYTDIQINTEMFSQTEVVAPENESIAVLMGWMPYNSTHNEFFQNESIEIFKRNLHAGSDRQMLKFSDVEVAGDAYTKWLVYNATMEKEGRKYNASYQVSVSQGRYYALVYYGLPGDFRENYGEVVKSMRNSSLYHPLNIEVPEFEPINVTPVSPYAGVSRSFGLKEGYQYVINKSMKGRYRFDVNSTDPIYLVIMKEEEYADYLRGEDAERLYREEGEDIDFEREFFEDNYTLYFLNNKGEAATVEFDLERVSNSTS